MAQKLIVCFRIACNDSVVGYSKNSYHGFNSWDEAEAEWAEAVGAPLKPRTPPPVKIPSARQHTPAACRPTQGARSPARQQYAPRQEGGNSSLSLAPVHPKGRPGTPKVRPNSTKPTVSSPSTVSSVASTPTRPTFTRAATPSIIGMEFGVMAQVFRPDLDHPSADLPDHGLAAQALEECEETVATKNPPTVWVVFEGKEPSVYTDLCVPRIRVTDDHY